jgi:hypothetical protein
LVHEEGYDDESRLFIASPSTKPPPDHPTEEEVQGALEAIGGPLQDFPFADEASKAAAVALLVTFFVRPHVTGCTPLFVIEAPAPGTGKTLLALTLYAAFSKERALVTTLPASGSEEEVRRKLFSSLSKHPDILVFDNISARLASDSLAAIITSPDFSDRVIGSSETRTHRNEAVLVGTGNNVSASEDIARRTVRIRLDAQSETPAAGRDFSIQDLPSWVEKNRPNLRYAVLVLIQNWLAKGKPPGPRRMASFEQFSAVVGGILEAAGLPDFLNAPKLVDTETEVLRALVSAWRERHGHHPVTAQLFLRLCEDTQQWPGSIARANPSEQSRLQSAGQFLAGLRDRIVAGQRICVRRDTRNKTNTYYLAAENLDGELRGGTGASTSRVNGGLIVVGGEEGASPSPKPPQAPANCAPGGES